ncbi:MAG: hypothetical protein R3E39_14180 [Anaerolineae bacterium]
MRDIYRIRTYDEFTRKWTESIQARIAEFLELIPQAVGGQLDYSIESLDILENWLLEKYPDYKSARMDSEYAVMDAAGSYVAEVFLKHLGGKWTIELDDQENAFLGVPGIRDYQTTDPIHMTLLPTMMVTTSIDRRTGHFIQDRIEQHLKK